MKVDCPLECDLPEDPEVVEVPVPRHSWSDVMICPNGTEEGLPAPCGRAFMVKESQQ